MRKELLIIFLIALIYPQRISAQDEARNDKSRESVVVLHSARKAALYSAVVPGLGQAYNKKYWKIPVVYAGFGVMGYFIYFNSSHFFEYKQALIDFIDTDPGSDSYLDLIGPGVDPGRFDPSLGSPDFNPSDQKWFEDQLENGMKYYKRYRDLSVILTFAWYALNIIDATVDGYLYSYDMNEDLSLYVDHQLFTMQDGVKGLGLKLGLSF